MAEVSGVNLHEEDDDSDPHQDNFVVNLDSTHLWSSHNFDGFDTSDLEFPPSEFRTSAVDHQHQTHRSIRSQIFVDGTSDADSSIVNIDFFDRENQVNFVVDLFHECVEQSDPNPNLDLNFGVIEGNDEMGLNNLELDLGLGLGGYTGDDNNSGFIVADCGDEFFVSRRGAGTVSESGESSNSGGPDYFMGGLRVVGIDSDLEDRGNGGVDDFESSDGNGNNDEGSSLPICWDSFQLEDNRDENNNDDFEWEEVEGRIDEREVLSMDVEVDDDASVVAMREPEEVGRGARNQTFANLGWEVLLNVHNLEAIDGLRPDDGGGYFDNDEYTLAEYEMMFGQFSDNESVSIGRPPASKSVVENLHSVVLTKEDIENNNALCSVCIDKISVGKGRNSYLVPTVTTVTALCHGWEFEIPVPFVFMSCQQMILITSIEGAKELLVHIDGFYLCLLSKRKVESDLILKLTLS